jgi:hypothetical protein
MSLAKIRCYGGVGFDYSIDGRGNTNGYDHQYKSMALTGPLQHFVELMAKNSPAHGQKHNVVVRLAGHYALPGQT